MMPVLTIPPDGQLLSVSLLRTHLRIDGTEDDALLQEYEAAALSYLDGWSGVLGRAILPQTLQQDFDGWGSHVLPVPDVVSAEVSYRDGTGDFVPGGVVTLVRNGAQMIAQTSGPATTGVRITYVCQMAEKDLPRVRQIVLLMIGNWYRNREAVVVGTVSELPMAARSLINSLQWRRV